MGASRTYHRPRLTHHKTRARCLRDHDRVGATRVAVASRQPEKASEISTGKESEPCPSSHVIRARGWRRHQYENLACCGAPPCHTRARMATKPGSLCEVIISPHVIRARGWRQFRAAVAARAQPPMSYARADGDGRLLFCTARGGPPCHTRARMATSRGEGGSAGASAPMSYARADGDSLARTSLMVIQPPHVIRARGWRPRAGSRPTCRCRAPHVIRARGWRRDGVRPCIVLSRPLWTARPKTLHSCPDEP